MGGFALVWLVGSVFTISTAQLGVSGKLWDVGFPRWLIVAIMLVGVWQWLWITPVLIRSRRRNNRGLYVGMLWGGILFSILNLALWVFVFFKLRHFSMQ